MLKEDIVVVAAKRTAVGNFNGTLANHSASELGCAVIKQLIADAKIDPAKIDDVIMGQVLTAAEGQNPARQASIKAGLPITSTATTINQVCGSGLKAVGLAFDAIRLGDAGIIIAGGQENMSKAPHAINLRVPTRMNDARMVDTMIRDGLWDAFNDYHMGITAENIASQFGISRQEQDELALASQNKAEAAQKAGKFAAEIVPVKVLVKKEEVEFANDEFIRIGATMDALTKLRPAFKSDGTVTAGNASGINDGAAAVMLMTHSLAKQHGLKPLAKIAGWAQAGVEPKVMGTGPVAAVRKLLSKLSWQVSDLDLIESNEAFAAQASYVNRELGWDMSKVNVNGGAIAIGHPIGASGARVLVTLLHEFERRKAKKALATLCIGGGMGVALAIESL